MRKANVILSMMAVAAAAYAIAPVTDGPLATPAFAATNCGGAQQIACTILQRPGRPCDRGVNHSAGGAFHPGWCNSPDRPRNTAAQTTVELCNHTNARRIWAAIGYYVDGQWFSEGWMELSRNECTVAGLPADNYGAAYSGDAYFLAVGDGLSWESDDGPPLCVPYIDAMHEQFLFSNATSMDCNGRNRIYYGVPHNMERGLRNYFDFTG